MKGDKKFQLQLLNNEADIIFTTLLEVKKSMFGKIIYLVSLLLIGTIGYSQDTLPKIRVTLMGKRALVSWINPYKNVTAINIQRSGDSIKNFTSIGSVLNVNAIKNGFVDPKEFLPNEQYYRLFIAFDGGTYLFTQSHRGAPDTSKTFVKAVVKEIDSVSSIPKIIPAEKKIPIYFVQSKHVYTGKDNNVIISLQDAGKNKYSLKVFEDNGDPVFVLNKIPQDYLIIDRANFGHSGLFRFELYENKNLIEKHKLFIPEVGKPMPLLDVNGYEIKNK